MRLTTALPPELVLIDPPVGDRGELFRLFGERFHVAGFAARASDVVARLMEREAILSTGIGGGVAVPHAQIKGLKRLVMAASTHRDGIPYPSLDEQPVRLVFCLLGDSTTTADHLAGLARLARLARRSEMLKELVAADSPSAFTAVLARFEGE